MNTERESLLFLHADQRISVLGGLGFDLSRLQEARIMVVGAGALGNEVLKNLALMGAGHIVIADFDTVERSNLARSILYREADCHSKQYKVDIAAARLREINPQMRFFTLNGDVAYDVGLGVFRRMDVVIGCVDNRLARLYINRYCHGLGISWVDGGILDLGGQINVFSPGRTCYECQLGPEAWGQIHFRMGCAERAMRYASAGAANTIPITSSVIAAMQVQEALKLIQDPHNPASLAGKQFYYEGMSNTYELLPTSALKQSCISHLRFDPIISCPDLSASSTIQEALAHISDLLEDPDPAIMLNYELAMEIITESGKIIPQVTPRHRLSRQSLESYGSEGEDVRIGRRVDEIDHRFPHLDLPLSAVGVPPLHILTIASKGKKHYVELSGDEDFLQFR